MQHPASHSRRSREIWPLLLLILGLCVGESSATETDWDGVYEIVSGTYAVCCSVLGETATSVPNESQRFVAVKLDSQNNSATMTFLGPDLRTVFNTYSCSLGGFINFSFDHGLVFTNTLYFHVDPDPNGLYWNYSVSNSANGIRIDGIVATAEGNCADAPTQFTHTNVLAVLIPPPRIQIAGFSDQGASLTIQGAAGWTEVTEASNDLAVWTPISTNQMPNSVCPLCPFVQVRDAANANFTHRFYRSFQFP